MPPTYPHLQCPSCWFAEPLSEEDPDATLSILHRHINREHAVSDSEAMQLLAKVTEVQLP